MKKTFFLSLILVLTIFTQKMNAQMMAFSDDVETLKTWLPAIDSITGMDVEFYEFPAPGRSAEAVNMFLENQQFISMRRPKAVFLQIGCNASADANPDYLNTLFDFPTGTVLNTAGKNKRVKRIAVSKPDDQIDVANFAGSLYMMVKNVPNTFQGVRVFLLPPVKAGENTSDLPCRQMAEVAQMMCVPYLETPDKLKDYDFLWTNEKPKIGKLLILGDSYSEQRRWINCLEDMAHVEVLNLGVSSATVRDRYANRTRYPYSDNPVKTDNEGNHNTLASQLLKLHRLLEGNKLYEGETSLKGYVPDVIIIQGGSNDNPDPQIAVDGYVEDIRRDRRTTFAGALAYLTRDLRKTFPNAQILATTTAGLYYGHTDRPFDFIEKSDQQRAAAKMMGVPVISWDLDGRLSFVFNNSARTGDGSESNPFLYNIESPETIDLLHPNNYGARFLAESVLHWMKVEEVF